jgi:NAD-dependent dihydropyrimidine dehydrogenase PreA subunit/flavodoxin
MSTTEIYYFSATGNSLAVAKDIADTLKGTLIPILPLLNKQTIHTDAEVIGIVFPIYDFKAPDLVTKFINKVSNLGSKYIFAICTYGVMPLKTMKKLKQTLAANNGILSGGFTVQMPHNGIGYTVISQEKQSKMFARWKQKSKLITHYIQNRKQGLLETTGGFGYIILVGIFLRMMPQILPMLANALFRGWGSLAFYADDRCNTCKVCEKVCPMENINIIDNKPIWGDNCISCFACIHWCPQKAIQIANLTRKMQRYHHPKVKVNEIIGQKINQ